MEILKRREWILRGGSLAALPLLASGCQVLRPFAKEERSTYTSVLLGSRPTLNKKRQPVLVLFDYSSKGFREILLPPMRTPHSTVLNPTNRSNILVVPNSEGFANLIDIETGEHVRQFRSRNKSGFYGHGVFSADGDYLFLTEQGKNSEGIITIFDSKTGRYIDDLPGHGIHPHEMHLINGGETFVVANNGYKKSAVRYPKSFSSLTYVDVKSGKLLDRVELGDLNLHITHLSVGSNGSVAMGMDMSTHPSKLKERDKAVVAFRKAGEGIQVLKAPDSVLSSLGRHVLSVAYDMENEIIGATNQYKGGPLTFWSSQRKEFIKKLDIVGSSGINFLPKKKVFLVSTHSQGLYQVSSPELKIVAHNKHPHSKLYIDGHGSVLA